MSISTKSTEKGFLLYDIEEEERLGALYYEIGRANTEVIKFIKDFRKTYLNEVKHLQKRAEHVLEIIVANNEAIIKNPDTPTPKTYPKTFRPFTSRR